VGGAEGAYPLGGELKSQLAFLDDHVVVAECLPLLEAHARKLASKGERLPLPPPPAGSGR
jgi:hypothetical protein